MSYSELEIAQQFHNDPDNCNILLLWLPGEHLRAAFRSLSLLHRKLLEVWLPLRQVLRWGRGLRREGNLSSPLHILLHFFFTMCKIFSNKTNFLIKQKELMKSYLGKELYVIHSCFHSCGMGRGRSEQGKGQFTAWRLGSTSAGKTSLKERRQIVSTLCSRSVSYTHLTLPTISLVCRSRWSPYH